MDKIKALSERIPRPAVEYGPHHQRSSDTLVELLLYGLAAAYIGSQSVHDPLWAWHLLATMNGAMWMIVVMLSILPVLLVFELEKNHTMVVIGTLMWGWWITIAVVNELPRGASNNMAPLYGIMSLVIIATFLLRVTLSTLHVLRVDGLRPPMLVRALYGIRADLKRWQAARAESKRLTAEFEELTRMRRECLKEQARQAGEDGQCLVNPTTVIEEDDDKVYPYSSESGSDHEKMPSASAQVNPTIVKLGPDAATALIGQYGDDDGYDGGGGDVNDTPNPFAHAFQR